MNMETRHIVALFAEKHDLLKDEDSLAKRRSLAYSLLEKKNVTFLTDFSPTLHYLKEVMADSGNLISLSPASNKEEHVEVYKLPLTQGEVVVYTGAGVHQVKTMLLRSADTIVALDDSAYTEAMQSLSGTEKQVYLLGGIGKKDVKTFLEEK